MTRASRVAAVILAAALAAACGKRGNPLPPLRPVPARIVDAAAVRTTAGVTLTFTVPAANLDGTTPPAISRVDVYAWQGAEGAVTPPAGVIIGERRNLRQSVPVIAPAPEGTPGTPGAKGLTPGSPAVVVDVLTNIDAPAVATMGYVLVPVAGSGRGRNGPPSAPLVVPAGALPAPPSGVTLGHTETEVKVSWDAPVAAVTGLSYQLVQTSATGEPADPSATPVPATVREAALPVQFGREMCVTVRSVVTAGRVTTAGAFSRPACLTPVDRFPPAAPEGLRAVQEGAAVALSWTAVTAPDLSGYIVLRGTGSADSLQPLMRVPIKETTYRDTTVRSGVTYFYAVYAEDTAGPPNVSQLSNRETVTVR